MLNFIKAFKENLFGAAFMIKKAILLIYLISFFCCTGSPDSKLNSDNDLINAVYSNDYNKSEKLLRRGANPDAADSKGNPSLIIAVNSGNTDLVKLLIDSGSNVNIKDSEGNTALIYSCLSGYYETAELLISAGADINILNSNNQSAYEFAERNGNEDIIRLLLMSGAFNLNEKLLKACFLGNYEEAARFIDGGADVNASDQYDESALMRAVNYGYFDIVNLLVQAGADVNAIYPELGDTVIMNAVHNEYFDITELLLKWGADPNKKNFNGDNALIWADRTDNDDIINLLVSYGADIQSLLNSKLINSCISGNLFDVKELIDSGANIDCIDELSGWTALMYAADKGYKRIVEYLISCGVDVNKKSRTGLSALNISIERENSQISSLLLKAGAEN